jgi:hypothetical protein
MLRELPFQTIGDIARHGLELHVYCPSCCSTRQPANLESRDSRVDLTKRRFSSGRMVIGFGSALRKM